MKSLYTALALWVAFVGAAVAQSANETGPSQPSSAHPKEDRPDAAPDPFGAKKDTIGDAMVAPLGDLNLNQTAIPPILVQAVAGPYLSLPRLDCPSIAYAIAPLDMVLGTDLDAPPSPLNPSLLERGSVLAGDTAVSAVRSATEGLVPFRSWVRKLSGAEAHSKKVRAAIAAGAVRRAYLKGLGQAMGCAPPAAPLPVKLPNKTNP